MCGTNKYDFAFHFGERKSSGVRVRFRVRFRVRVKVGETIVEGQGWKTSIMRNWRLIDYIANLVQRCLYHRRP